MDHIIWIIEYAGVPKMAQKVFEGDVLVSIFIGRFFSINQNRENSIFFEDFLGHPREPRVWGSEFQNKMNFETEQFR